jgi:hypothetical protein
VGVQGEVAGLAIGHAHRPAVRSEVIR